CSVDARPSGATARQRSAGPLGGGAGGPSLQRAVLRGRTEVPRRADLSGDPTTRWSIEDGLLEQEAAVGLVVGDLVALRVGHGHALGATVRPCPVTVHATQVAVLG